MSPRAAGVDGDARSIPDVSDEASGRPDALAADPDAGRGGAPSASRGGSAAARIAAGVAALVLVAVIALVAFTAGGHAATAAIEPTPTDASADAGFARDMQVHHLQGVELAMIVRDRTSDEEVRRLAYDMATTQAQQSGQMYAWLEAWGLSQLGTAPSMAWMAQPAGDGASSLGAHDHGTDVSGADVSASTAMPGYATPAQIEALRAATGVEAERVFLELMIAHHRGGVEMAEAAAARAKSRVVLTLADAIVASQNGEIALMQEMLAARS